MRWRAVSGCGSSTVRRPPPSPERQAAHAARLRRRPHLSRADGDAGGQRSLHLQRLRPIKSYGFNHVRHHSTIMPPEYYDACDEVGMIPRPSSPSPTIRSCPAAGDVEEHVSAGHGPAAAAGNLPPRVGRPPSSGTGTIPRSSAGSWATSSGTECRCGATSARSPAGSIRRVLRRRGRALRHEYSRCRRTTATRWTSISSCSTCRSNRDRQSGQVPHARPKKPVISHETGNYVTFSRPDLVDQFQHNIKPFWLTGGKAKLAKLGLLGEADRWAEKSERLYLLCHKYNLEALPQEPLPLRLSLVAVPGLLDDLQRDGGPLLPSQVDRRGGGPQVQQRRRAASRRVGADLSRQRRAWA